MLNPPKVTPTAAANSVTVSGDATGFTNISLTETCTPPVAPSGTVSIPANYSKTFQTFPGVTYEFFVQGTDPNTNQVVTSPSVSYTCPA
jgi:hypothetical protein